MKENRNGGDVIKSLTFFFLRLIVDCSEHKSGRELRATVVIVLSFWLSWSLSKCD